MAASLPTPTERLILRRHRAGDEPALATLCADFAVSSMTGRIPHPYTEADAAAFVAAMRETPAEAVRGFAIDLVGRGLIGGIGFHQVQGGLPGAGDLDGRVPEVGYWLGRPYWGAGLASEALGAAMAWARETLRLRAVLASHYLDNPASGRVLEKAGFLATGAVIDRLSIARGEAARGRTLLWLP